MPVDVLVPPLGATTDTLRLVEWYHQEGEAVTKDEPLFAVETDKATLDVEAPASGVLRHVSAPPGAEVAALSRIAVIAAPGEVAADGGERVANEGVSGKSKLTEPSSSAHPPTTAPVTLTTETDATELVALRARQRAAGVPCSYNDLLLWLLARALREHPRLNASLQGEEIRVWRRVNIGLAVASEQGLRVPVVR